MGYGAAAVAIGTTVAGAVAQGAGARRANKANERLADQQNRRNIENWNKQNLYNDPSAQMRRLQAAGLNPRLIYGQSSGMASGNAGNISSYDRAENKTEAAGMDAFNDITNQLKVGVQTDNIKAQTDTEKQRKLLTMADIMNKNADTANKTFDVGLKKQLEDINIETATEARDKAIYDRRISGYNKDILFTGKWGNRVKLAANELAQDNSKTANAKSDEIIRKFHALLAQKGLTPQDPKVMRMLTMSGVSLHKIEKIFGLPSTEKRDIRKFQNKFK